MIDHVSDPPGCGNTLVICGTGRDLSNASFTQSTLNFVGANLTAWPGS